MQQMPDRSPAMPILLAVGGIEQPDQTPTVQHVIGQLLMQLAVQFLQLQARLRSGRDIQQPAIVGQFMSSALIIILTLR